MFFLKLISRLPLPVLYVLSDIFYFFTYYVVRYRRRLVMKNLRNSFPEKTDAERHQIMKKFYRNLSDYGVETLKLLTISKEELRERVKFEDLHILEKFASEKQSIIFMASHQFNWEWLLVSASIQFPFDIDFVYQPVNNQFFEKLSIMCRTRFGAYPVQRADVARTFVKRKNIVRGVATVADQYPGYKSDKKYESRFMNQDTVFFLGTNSMVLMAQYPALFYSAKKIKRGYYVSTPHIVGMPPYDKTSSHVIENYVREVEKAIIDEPDGYLWSHNRWKKRHLKNRENTQA